ncbi:adhesion G-protein coupled receptor G2-like [Dendronephthya gigantea]|uniref:adhesion G-protein coupled receptor G2-like n=1 Tax=Dendronephthya gigantea TaxID=151771 RepID=UPI00106AFECD|nr:adhesion G-protein coupled receptor G2-like [Dendronephthya gigantea]
MSGSIAAANNSLRNATAIFVLYTDTKYFRVSLTDTTRTKSRLNSLVIAGSVKGLTVANLRVPGYIALPMIEPGDTKSTLCSYWEFSIGDWSQDGCKFERVLEDGRVLCSCNHFTNFAMLMDINPGKITAHYKILGVVSYVGCALSLIGLALTIIVILILRDLRTKAPSQILLNFCVALSLTIIVFLAAAERSNTSTLAGCRAAAIALHYFLLATFFWMAVEAYNMYRGFVIVFSDSHPPKFITKCCLFAWGTPTLIVVITMIAAIDKYGDETYCRLHGVAFIVAFLTPTILILVGNIVVYCFIIRSLLTSGTKVTSDRKKKGFQQAKQGIAIVVLLGLTWLFGILAIGDAKPGFQYLFCIFNTLQGLFVFLFFVVFSSGTRRQLKKLVKSKIVSESREGQPKKKKFSFHFIFNKGYIDNNTASTGTSESKSSNKSLDVSVISTSSKKTNESDSERAKDHVDTKPKISSKKNRKK